MAKPTTSLAFGDGLAPGVRVAPDQLVRILPAGDADDAHLAHAVIGPELGQQPFAGGRVARQVDVVTQRDRLAVFQRQVDLAARQRRSQAGHHVLEAGLVGGHHIGIALDDDRQLLAADRRLREIDGEQRLALVEERPRGRVEILGSVLAGHDPPAEAHGPAGRVANRDDHPTAKPVDHPAAVGRTGKAGTDELLRAEAPRRQPAGQRLPRVWRVPDGEPIQRLLREAALVQVGAGALALLGLDEHFPIPRNGRLQRLAHAPLAPILARGALGELDARPLRQPRQRLTEVEAVALHQEREDVAALAAAEAMPRLAVRADDEGWRLLRVERAEALERGAGPLEGHGLTDQVGDRNLRFDFGSDAGGRRGHTNAQAVPGPNMSRGLSIAAA